MSYRYAPVILPNSSLCCYITVSHSEHDEDVKWVDIGVLSNHLSAEYEHWRGFNGRLKRAWRALKGQPQTDFEFLDESELDEFVVAVQAAGVEAFGNHAVAFATNTANTTLPLGNAETVSE